MGRPSSVIILMACMNHELCLPGVVANSVVTWSFRPTGSGPVFSMLPEMNEASSIMMKSATKPRVF